MIILVIGWLLLGIPIVIRENAWPLTVAVACFPVLGCFLISLHFEWFYIFDDRIEARYLLGVKNQVFFSDVLSIEETVIYLTVHGNNKKQFYIFNNGRKNSNHIVDQNSSRNQKKYNLRIYKTPQLEEFIKNHPSLKDLPILDIKPFKENVDMTYGADEYEQLKFLTQYNFEVINLSDSKCINICLMNDECCITYHEWPQFGDFNILITKNLDDLKNYHYQAVYGYSWLLENVLPKYRQCVSNPKYSTIDLFSFYLRDQLENHRNLFDEENK